MSEPRPMTIPEMRKIFLDRIRRIVDYWKTCRGADADDRITGVAFSILSMFDGCFYGPKWFRVVAHPTLEEAKEYRDAGDNWPVIADLARDASLHDEFEGVKYDSGQDQSSAWENQCRVGVIGPSGTYYKTVPIEWPESKGGTLFSEVVMGSDGLPEKVVMQPAVRCQVCNYHRPADQVRGNICVGCAAGSPLVSEEPTKRHRTFPDLTPAFVPVPQEPPIAPLGPVCHMGIENLDDLRSALCDDDADERFCQSMDTIKERLGGLDPARRRLIAECLKLWFLSKNQDANDDFFGIIYDGIHFCD